MPGVVLCRLARVSRRLADETIPVDTTRYGTNAYIRHTSHKTPEAGDKGKLCSESPLERRIAIMTSAEVEQRLQDGLERVAKLDDRPVDEVRRDAIKGYLARRGLELLDDLAVASPGTSLTEEEAMRIALEEIAASRRERQR